MLDYTHDWLLVVASLAVALMAGFTGLSLTRGASALPLGQRKLVVSMSAVALGGGIWSMHFVAMLGLQLPIQFYYDSLITLISALVAILIAGLALLVVHFGQRTRARVVLAGLIVGLGIPVMHYVGMSGMQICRPVYGFAGVVIALATSVTLSVAAFLIAYDKRAPRNIVLGTLGFGLAVFAVHFTAMAGTGFVLAEGALGTGPLISNGVLAFGVTLSVFVLSGAFLLTGVTFAPHAPPAPVPVASFNAEPEGRPSVSTIPYEKDGQTRFTTAGAVAAIRAEGHYTVLYVGAQKLFCPWSITEAEARVPQNDFVRTHRSYLVNRNHVSGFERKKDTGVCYFDSAPALGKVPVSRARLSEVRTVLGL
ncbi:MAG: LytTR family transcriptional regulator DNA-binding domain-containing protein [Pararhodobacter sp.]|nr:LytTR family transcriptional regulator DNA-binding domain-containing protein [Pararhodobacter sp.]